MNAYAILSTTHMSSSWSFDVESTVLVISAILALLIYAYSHAKIISYTSTWYSKNYARLKTLPFPLWMLFVSYIPTFSDLEIAAGNMVRFCNIIGATTTLIIVLGTYLPIGAYELALLIFVIIELAAMVYVLRVRFRLAAFMQQIQTGQRLIVWSVLMFIVWGVQTCSLIISYLYEHQPHMSLLGSREYVFFDSYIYHLGLVLVSFVLFYASKRSVSNRSAPSSISS